MNIAIINTGTELMLGCVLNSHQQWLCAQFARLGYVVTRQIAIADNGPAILLAVREALAWADLIVTTGGLGSTSDDRTRDLLAELLGQKLVPDALATQNIKNFFALRKRRIPENALKQAFVPPGAIVLQNACGTAPGLVLPVERRLICGSRSRLALPGQAKITNAQSQTKLSHFTGSVPSDKVWLIMLPGPPRELQPMFTEQVVPLVQQAFPQKKTYVCRTLRTTGLGESSVEEKIQSPLHILGKRGLELGYGARVGEVEVRLAGRGKNAEKLVDEAEKIVRREIGLHIFGQGEEPLEAVVVRALTQHQQTLALAESCTGGLIAHRVTNVPGASAVLMAGLVTYSNEAKQRWLGVRAKTLEKFGAVSEPTVREMAEGARRRNKTSLALAVTGIAGPGGGTPEKPVGTVYIALASASKTVVEKHFNPYDRETFKFLTSQQALDLLRRENRGQT